MTKMSEHINFHTGLFQLPHTLTIWQLLILLMVVFQLAPMSNTFETGSRYYYENQPFSSKGVSPKATSNDPNEIPLEFYQQLNNITDISEFIELFVDKDDMDTQLGLQDIGSGNVKRNVERANIVRAEPVGCQPVNTIVPLTPINTAGENNQKFTYWPACTYVMRCSDCCDSKKVGCQPVETELVNYRVLKYVYGNRKLAGTEIIPVEKHLSCAVQCRTKAEDCKSFHIYRPDLCSCVCKSTESTDIHDELAKCSADSNKIWDDQNCRCLCRENLPCTTGTIFDETDCKCVAPKTPLTPEERRRFIVKPTLVEPDNSTIYNV